jgi:hypothetical protein
VPDLRHLVGTALHDQARAVGARAGKIAAERVRFAPGDDDEISVVCGQRAAAGDPYLALSLRHQVVDNDVLGVRHVLDTYLDSRGLPDAPRRGEFGVEKHGPREPHESQHVG